MSKDDKDLEESSGSSSEAEAAPKATGGPLAMEFPPELAVWQEARRLVADKKVRVEDLAICTSQDPALIIDLLKTANALYFSGGKSPITTAKTAIVRLGHDVVLENLDKIRDRQQVENGEVSKWFEVHRSRGKRTSILARMLGETLARSLADDCQTAGLLMHSGEMLAVLHLGEDYVKMAEELSHSAVIYRLVQEFRFDIERMTVNYLRRHGIPESLLFAFDRDARIRTPERAIMRPICMAAAELVEVFDLNKWEKFAPGKPLPPKSAVRGLQLSEAQYLKLYERSSEYLFSARLLDEKKRAEALAPAQPAEVTAQIPEEQQSLETEIQGILNPEEAEEANREETEPAPAPQAAAKPAPKVAPKATRIKELEESLTTQNDQFSLESHKGAKKTIARVKAPAVKKRAEPTLTSKRGSEVVTRANDVLNKARTSEELLSSLLDMLIVDGVFEKTALVVVSRDRKKAIVVAARGPNIGNGQKLSLDDPLSPLAQCFSKVQSWGSKESEHSPFGSKSFALAPIDADHDTPVALYADCGNNGSISFEARRVFRTVVGLLNERLPQIPGGIPVEI